MQTPNGMLLTDLPAMMPPPGVKSNFENPETNATTLMVINWVFTPLAALMVCVRISTRAILKREHGYGWDDLFIVLAVLGSIAHSVLVTISIPFGYGRHIWDIHAFSLTEQRLHVFTSFEQTYFLTVCFIKISILLLYNRLFGIYDASRRLVYVGLVGVVLITIPAFGVAVACSMKCDGIQALTVTHCLAHRASTVATVFSACNSATHCYILIIPINRILKLRVDMKKKLGLLAILFGGTTACVMSIVRLVMVIINFDTMDPLWDDSKVTPFTIVEMNLGIICSCMMFVPAFSKKVQTTVNSLLGSRLGSGKGVPRGSRSEIIQNGSGSKRDIEYADGSVPDLPPFLGNLSLL